MTPIEERQIVGFTGKLLKGIIWQTATLAAIACTFYFSLKGDINRLYILRDEGNKYWELKFEQLQLQNNLFQKQLDEITIRIDHLRNEIKN